MLRHQYPAGLRKLLTDGLGMLGVASTPEVIERLLVYVETLRRWNTAYNLTAVRRLPDIVTRHLLDSLAVAGAITGPLIDVGSGAGLPGLPLAITAPDRAVTLLDSNGKKVRFLRNVVQTLELRNVNVIQTRVQSWMPEGRYTCVVSRAFARLGAFIDASAHLASDNGRWFAMKGRIDPDELAEIPEGYHILAVKPLRVPNLPASRNLVIVSRTNDFQVP